jgi:hypothetical protein
VKLQPYVQASVASRASQKLSFRFFGPYQTLDKIGSVAYKLKLPPSSSIHLVFHVSQLKGAVPVTHIASPLPDSIDGLQVPSGWLHQVLKFVSTGLPPLPATWEDVEALRQRFPRAPAWGQAGSHPGGMSAILEKAKL